MGSLYKRGNVYFIKYKDATGKWVRISAKTKNRKEAERILRDIEAQLHRGPDVPVVIAPASPLFKDAAATWLEKRKELKQRNWSNEEAHVRIHILPELGEKPVGEIRPLDIRTFATKLREKPALRGQGGPGKAPLAPRTVHKIVGTLHKLFEDLVADEIIERNPCVLKRSDMPKKKDRDPEWRPTAVFERGEVELLISSEAVPEERRLLYALLFLTGMRLGEAAGLRFRHIAAAKPLNRITVAHSYEQPTKTEVTRTAPMHPVLAAALAEWRLGGFMRFVGRPPTTDDHVVPQEDGMMLSRHRVRKDLMLDFAALGLRHRRVHDMRRTFISLAQADGATKDVLEHITHGPRGNIMNIYTTLPWETLCEAVACLQIERRAKKAK